MYVRSMILSGSLTRILLQTDDPIQYHFPIGDLTGIPVQTEIPDSQPLEPYSFPACCHFLLLTPFPTLLPRFLPSFLSHSLLPSLLPSLLRPRRPAPHLLQPHLDHRVREHLLAARVDIVQKPAFGRIRVLAPEQRVEDAGFGSDGRVTLRRRSDPLDVGFWFLERRTAVGGFVVGGVDGGDDVVGCGLERGGGDGEGDFEEADGFAGREPEEILAVDGAEVGAVDVDGLREGDGVRAERRVFGREGEFDVLRVVWG